MSTRIYLGKHFVRLFSFEDEAVRMAQLLTKDGDVWSPIAFDCGWLVQEKKGEFLDDDGIIPEHIAKDIRERLEHERQQASASNTLANGANTTTDAGAAAPDATAGKPGEPRDYLKDWLCLTTCGGAAVKRSVLFENDTHIVLKHNSHSSYCGRASGSQTCQSYAVLYRKADINAQLYHFQYSSPRLAPLKKWEGRINLKTVRAQCLGMGIEFPITPTSSAPTA